MFTEDSRYAKVDTLEITVSKNRSVAAVKLRKLPIVRGNSYTVNEGDRLDLLAYRKYKQPAKFWHIADANTDLEAKTLVADINRKILLPET